MRMKATSTCIQRGFSRAWPWGRGSDGRNELGLIGTTSRQPEDGPAMPGGATNGRTQHPSPTCIWSRGTRLVVRTPYHGTVTASRACRSSMETSSVRTSSAVAHGGLLFACRWCAVAEIVAGIHGAILAAMAYVHQRPDRCVTHQRFCRQPAAPFPPLILAWGPCWRPDPTARHGGKRICGGACSSPDEAELVLMNRGVVRFRASVLRSASGPSAAP